MKAKIKKSTIGLEKFREIGYMVVLPQIEENYKIISETFKYFYPNKCFDVSAIMRVGVYQTSILCMEFDNTMQNKKKALEIRNHINKKYYTHDIGGERENAGRKKGEKTKAIGKRVPIKYHSHFVKLVETELGKLIELERQNGYNEQGLAVGRYLENKRLITL